MSQKSVQQSSDRRGDVPRCGWRTEPGGGGCLDEQTKGSLTNSSVCRSSPTSLGCLVYLHLFTTYLPLNRKWLTIGRQVFSPKHLEAKTNKQTNKNLSTDPFGSLQSSLVFLSLYRSSCMFGARCPAAERIPGDKEQREA